MNWDQFLDSLKARGEKLDEKEVECKNISFIFLDYLESLLPQKNYP